VYRVSSRPDILGGVTGEPAIDEAVAPGNGRPRPGRPRKWASEAERKRAYRQRLALDLDNPLGLRHDLRAERRRTARLKQENDRLRARLAVAERRVAAAEAAADEAQGRLDGRREGVSRDRQNLSAAQARVVELEAELRADATSARPSSDRAVAGRAPASPDDRPVRRCSTPGCSFSATYRVQGPRGVERDACESHAQLGRRRRPWRVIRRY
jgi:hypothetical protein